MTVVALESASKIWSDLRSVPIFSVAVIVNDDNEEELPVGNTVISASPYFPSPTLARESVRVVTDPVGGGVRGSASWVTVSPIGS